MRTSSGIDWQSAVMGLQTGQPTGSTYIALSSDTATVLASDTSLMGEFTTGGLARALGTYAHTSGQSSYTISFTFTATAPNVINKTALFNAAAGGTMVFASLEPTPLTVVSGNTDTQVTTVSI